MASSICARLAESGLVHRALDFAAVPAMLRLSVLATASLFASLCPGVMPGVGSPGEGRAGTWDRHPGEATAEARGTRGPWLGWGDGGLTVLHAGLWAEHE